MRRWLSTCLLIPLALGFGEGCGGSDPEPVVLDQDFYRLQDCAGVGLERAGAVFDALLDLVGVLADPEAEPPGHVLYHPDTKEFFVGADLDGDDFTEAVVEGTLETDSEVSDGLQAWESVTVNWEIGVGVPVTGSGQLVVTMRSETEVEAIGFLRVSDPEGCTFQINSMNFRIETAGGPDVIPDGAMVFEVVSAPERMGATIEFDGTRYADVTADYGGMEVHYVLDLETGEVVG